MSSTELKIAELEAQLEFMNKFIAKIEEKNTGIIAPSAAEISSMRKEAAEEINKKHKDLKVLFE